MPQDVLFVSTSVTSQPLHLCPPNPRRYHFCPPNPRKCLSRPPNLRKCLSRPPNLRKCYLVRQSTEVPISSAESTEVPIVHRIDGITFVRQSTAVLIVESLSVLSDDGTTSGSSSETGTAAAPPFLSSAEYMRSFVPSIICRTRRTDPRTSGTTGPVGLLIGSVSTLIAPFGKRMAVALSVPPSSGLQ